MRILVSWLRDFVDIDVPAAELADLLAMRGFEVAAIEEPPPGVLQSATARRNSSDDAVIDFEVTANRPDCLSVLGIAREVATSYGLALRSPQVAAPATTDQPYGLPVTIEDDALCPRYAAAVAEVTVGASPGWLANRLHAAGIRPINNIVDATNYVLIELGHPLHAFDLDRLAGPALRIRRARSGERITTLDGQDRPLDEQTLVIADAERPQAIAGVMGGAASEVGAATRRIVLESAYFDPVSIRRASKRLGLKTEASARFERGTDINAPVWAANRVGTLLGAIGAGRRLEGVIDRYPAPRAAVRLALRRWRVGHLLGVAVADHQIEQILGSLGLRVDRTPEGWDVSVPTFRVDLRREVDLIEEVARHFGYDRLPATFPALRTPPRPPDPRIPRDHLVRHALTAAGFSEGITFTFIETRAAEAFLPGAELADLVGIGNPLSGSFAVLRPSLYPGLLQSIAHNRRHGLRDVRLFELGARFSVREGETRGVALAWTGAATGEHWGGGGREVDFFDLKGVVERVCEVLGVTPQWSAATVPYLEPGQTAEIRAGEVTLGTAGRLAPAPADIFGLPRGDHVYVADLDLDLASALLPRKAGVAAGAEAVAPLPRYPSIVRDISIVVDGSLPAANVRETIRANAPSTLVRLQEFDRYQGTGVPDGRISLSLRLTFQDPDRTLTDSEIQRAMEQILAALAREHRAVQR